MTSFLFLGYCSHTDLFREYLGRTGAGVVTDDPSHADAVCVFERDSARHLDLALPHLRAGLPVFVDKPAAPTVAEVARMLEAGTFTSFSTLRWADGIDQLSNARELTIAGPARPDDPSGWAFYAVHAIEIAHQLCGGVPGPVAVHPTHGGLTVEYDLDRAAIRLDFSPAASEWSVSGMMADGSTEHLTITAGPGYYEPACARIVDFARSAHSPIDPAGLLGVASVVEALAD